MIFAPKPERRPEHFWDENICVLSSSPATNVFCHIKLPTFQIIDDSLSVIDNKACYV